VKSRERWRFFGGSRKILPDLDEPNPKIMEKGLATFIWSKALTIFLFLMPPGVTVAGNIMNASPVADNLHSEYKFSFGYNKPL